MHVWGALAATLVAWVAYLVARHNHVLPDPGYAVVLFTVAPTSAATAGVVLWARARADADQVLGWVATGVGVSFAAMLLQFLALPEVAGQGGPLGTDGGGLILLYLLFHWSLLLGALAGTAGVAPRWRPVAAVAGLILAFALAYNVVPASLVLRADQHTTGVVTAVEYLTAAVALGTMIAWVVRCGRTAPALHGWVAVALSFNAYGTLLNVIGSRRYDEEWWASLSMRVATYTVLAVAAGVTVLAQLRRYERYAEDELTRRETELRASLHTSGQLLTSAEALTGALTETDVGRMVATTASAATAARRVSVIVLDEPAGAIRLLASTRPEGEPVTRPGISAGIDAALPGAYALRTGKAVFTSAVEETRARFPDLARLADFGDTVATAALPLRLATGRVGALVVTHDRDRGWTDDERQVLAGIANQAAQALQRAQLFERERSTLEILQRGMLPQRLAGAPGVEVVARYLPAAQGLDVGGDWYDSIPLPDGRNVLVVGDVMGKGAQAAAVMGRARTAVRALAALDPHPVAILDGLDKLVPELTPEGFFTLLYVLLDPGTGVAEVARAGHLPLLLAGAEGTCRFIDAGGSPAVGIFSEARTSATIEVPGASTLVLFTDGLVEDRVTGIDPGLTILAEALHDHGGAPLDVLADHLLTVEGSAAAYDDVCLLLARTQRRGR